MPLIGLHALARHRVLHPLIQRENGAVAWYRNRVGTRQVREHVHHEVRIGQPVELTLDFVGSSAGVAGLFHRSSVHISLSQWSAQALTHVEQLATSHLAAPTLIRFGVPDILHGAIAVRQQLVLVSGASGERSCRSEEHTSELPSLMRSSYAVFC